MRRPSTRSMTRKQQSEGLLQFAESGSNGKPGGTDSREQPADEANDSCPNNSLYQKLWRDLESKRDLAKALEIHGGRLEPVKGKVCEGGTNRAAQESEEQ